MSEGWYRDITTLNDAMKALRLAGSGDTRYAMRQASDIERLLRRIDGKENNYE